MSYGSTAETSFSLVRTLVAHDPALLERVDAVLGARGFAKLVTRDTPAAQHPRARAEAVRELKWLAEYLQNVYKRADKFTPQEKPGRLAVVDDDDDDDDDDGDDDDDADDGDAREREGLGSEGAQNGVPANGHSLASAASLPAARTPPRESAMSSLSETGSSRAAKVYDHTSEESSGTSEEPEELTLPSAAAPLSREAPPSTDVPATRVRTHAPPQGRTRAARAAGAAAAREAELQAADAAAQAEAPSLRGARRPAAREDDLANARLQKRQQHLQEREQARKAHEQLRLAREQQRARDDEQRQLQKQQRREEKRRQASASHKSAASNAAADAAAPDDVEIWCLCRQPAYGFMLACANPKCPYEWFHGECVNQETAPKARWFCPICRPTYAFAPRGAPARAAAPKQGARKSTPARVAAAAAAAVRRASVGDAEQSDTRAPARRRLTRAASRARSRGPSPSAATSSVPEPVSRSRVLKRSAGAAPRRR